MEADAVRAGELAGKLAGYQGPGYLKVYLARLLESAKTFLSAGDARAAAYCLDKVDAGLENVPAPREPKPAPAAPFETLRARWRGEAVRSAASVLARHGGRLSPLEAKAFRDRLAKVETKGEGGPSLPELRRRLYARVLKSQQAGLRRRGLPELAPPPADGPIIGPYNDGFNLRGLLEAVSAADAGWVDELLDLYRGLSGLKGLMSAASALKK